MVDVGERRGLMGRGGHGVGWGNIGQVEGRVWIQGMDSWDGFTGWSFEAHCTGGY